MNSLLEKAQTLLLVAVLAFGVFYSIYIFIGAEFRLEYSLMAFPYIFLPLGILIREKCDRLAIVLYSISLIALIVFTIVIFSPI